MKITFTNKERYIFNRIFAIILILLLFIMATFSSLYLNQGFIVPFLLGAVLLAYIIPIWLYYK